LSLAAYILRRVFWTVPLLLGVMFVTFLLMRGAGGSPFRPPEGYVGVPPSYARVLSEHYHLGSPWFVEFGYWVESVFTLQFGPSLVLRYVDVGDVIRRALPVTVELVLLAAAWAVPAGIALGVWAGSRRGRVADLLATATASVLLVLPVFFVVFVLRQYVVWEWHLLPIGWDSWRSRLLPVLALGLAPAGYVARLVRAAFVEALQEDYVRTALAKGLRRSRVLWVHVLRNSLVPLLSAAIPMIALLITGAFFVEDAFTVPGVSGFFISAVRTRDYPMILNLTAALAVVVLGANLLADVLLAIADPRIRERTGR
jgi:ABC-type dipeptide/oligopeptide/nickel transport system permease component